MNIVRKTHTKAQNGAGLVLMVAALIMMACAVPPAQADQGLQPVSKSKARAQLAAQKAAVHFARQGYREQQRQPIIRVNAKMQVTPKR